MSSGYAELLTSPAGTVLRQVYSSFFASAVNRGMTFGVPDTSYAILKDPSVYELIRRDAVVFACMEARKHAVASTSWGCSPIRENPLDAKAASVMEEILGEIDDFDSARLKLADADFTGSAYAKIKGQWIQRSFGGAGPMRWWVPTNLLDIDRRRILLTVDNKDKSNPIWGMKISDPYDNAKWNPVAPESRQWLIEHTYDDAEISLGYGRGIIDALYHYVFAKAKIFVEGVQAVERWGQGRTVLYIDPNRLASTTFTNEEMLQQVVDTFQKTMARHVSALQVGDEAKILNGPGEGWQLIDTMLTRVDAGIARVILGSVMPSGGDSGDSGGSFARAKVEQDSSETLITFSRRSMAATYTRSLIDLCWRLNRANFVALGLGTAARPKLVLTSDANPDPKDVVDRAVALLGVGCPLKKSEVYEGAGFTIPGSNDEVIQPQAPVGPDGLPMAGAPDLLQRLKQRITSQPSRLDSLKARIEANKNPVMESLKAKVAERKAIARQRFVVDESDIIWEDDAPALS